MRRVLATVALLAALAGAAAAITQVTAAGATGSAVPQGNVRGPDDAAIEAHFANCMRGKGATVEQDSAGGVSMSRPGWDAEQGGAAMAGCADSARRMAVAAFGAPKGR